MHFRSLGRFAALATGLVVLTVGGSVAEAATTSLPAATSACSSGVLSQPFLAFHDQNFYSLMPGENADGFNGAGWTLTNGAKIVTTTLADGKTASVLDLPSNATAVSPVVCVTSAYPVARMEIRDLVGAEGVAFNVEYLGTSTATKPKSTGQVHSNTGTSWDASGQVNIQPNGNIAGWQPMRLVLAGKGNTSDFQIYNLYIDPRCMGA
ncbi:MAG TPA: hypothetical protein VID68_03655 [Solirubrobacteraceae bacterium]|jgi:hypothetical protein